MESGFQPRLTPNDPGIEIVHSFLLLRTDVLRIDPEFPAALLRSNRQPTESQLRFISTVSGQINVTSFFPSFVRLLRVASHTYISICMYHGTAPSFLLILRTLPTLIRDTSHRKQIRGLLLYGMTTDKWPARAKKISARV